MDFSTSGMFALSAFSFQIRQEAHVFLNVTSLVRTMDDSVLELIVYNYLPEKCSDMNSTLKPTVMYDILYINRYTSCIAW